MSVTLLRSCISRLRDLIVEAVGRLRLVTAGQSTTASDDQRIEGRITPGGSNTPYFCRVGPHLLR